MWTSRKGTGGGPAHGAPPPRILVRPVPAVALAAARAPSGGVGRGGLVARSRGAGTRARAPRPGRAGAAAGARAVTPPRPLPRARVRGAAQGERGPAPPPRPRLARGGRSDRCRRRSRPRGMTWGGSGSRLPREIWGLRRAAERCAVVPSRGRGTGGRGGRPAGPGARGRGLGRRRGPLGRPVVEGGVSVTGTRPAGGTNLAGSWGAGTSPGRRGGGSRPSASTRGAPWGRCFLRGEREERPARGLSLRCHGRRVCPAPGARELVLLPPQLSLGCILLSPYIAARSLFQPAASNPCGFHSTSRTVSHKSQSGGCGVWRDSLVFASLFPRTPPSQVDGCLSARRLLRKAGPSWPGSRGWQVLGGQAAFQLRSGVERTNRIHRKGASSAPPSRTPRGMGGRT